MADIILVSKSTPALSQNQTLDGTDYVLHFEWNMRGGWFMGLADAADEWIFTPRQMTTGSDMLKTVRHDARCPPGKLLIVDLSETDAEPGYEDLVSGTLVDLEGNIAVVYVPEAEL
jgi:hypothetical protein